MAHNTRGRMVLLLIGGLPLTMILASTWLWFFVVRGDLDLLGLLGTANRGELIQPPRQIDVRALREATGEDLQFAALEPRWTLVIPARGGRCAEDCERNLYTTRQIKVAMGKDTNRLRRVLIGEVNPGSTELAVRTLSDGRPATGTFTSYLETEHKALQAWVLPDPAHGELFPEHGVDESTWYLVDPAGWVMMAYNKDVPYKDVIADLKFLLKNSGG